MAEVVPSSEALRYNFRKLFYAHVAAVAVTVAVVIPLLLGIVAIPHWVALVYCSLIGCASLGFAIATISYLHRNSLAPTAAKSELLLVSIGLSGFQLICVAPVLLAIFAPSLRFVSLF
jgi:hypothetical protein